MLIKFSPKNEHLKMVCLSATEGIVPEKTMVQLLPGTNEVTENEWKCMRGNIEKELNSGEITILAQRVGAGKGQLGGKKAKDLTEMPVNIAVTYIAECTNKETLDKWYSEETREEVRLHLTKRYEKLGLDVPELALPNAPNMSPMSLNDYEDDSLEKDEEENAVNENTANENEVHSDTFVEELKAKKKDELLAIAKSKGVTYADGKNKEELIQAIMEVAKKEEE